MAAFSVALTFADLIGRPVTLLTGALLPFMARYYGTGEIRRVADIYALSTKVAAWLGFFIAGWIAANAQLLLQVLYADKFNLAVPLVRMLAVAGAVGAIATAGSALVYAEGRAGFVLKVGMFGAAASVVAGLTVVPAYGAAGAAVARAIIQGALILAGTVYIVKLGYAFPVRSYLTCAVLSGVTNALVAWIQIPSVGALGHAVLHLVLAGSTYLFGTWLAGVFHHEEVTRLRQVFYRVAVRRAKEA